MSDNLVQARVEALRRLTRRQMGPSLHRALKKSSASDIVVAIAHLTFSQTRFLTDQLESDTPLGGEVLMGMGDETLERLVPELSLERLLGWVREMEPDDQVDLLGRFSEQLREQLLETLSGEARADVEELMAWPSDSAGGIMSPAAFRALEETTCREAIHLLQEQTNLEMVFYLYISNSSGQLVGVTSLRNLLTHSPTTTLQEFMSPEVITVSPETDQEQVARIAARYDLLAVPVVNEMRQLLGIVTIDDVIDVIREEAAEDMLLMAGVGDSFDPHGASALNSARGRFGWLVVTLFAGLILAEVIGQFESVLQRNATLAGFIPVVMGMGGNVGIQAATITVRNLATGHVSPGEGVRALLLREGLVGLLLGLSFGSVLCVWSLLRYWPSWEIGASVGLAILLSLFMASTLGSLIPLALQRAQIDPAVATGPFVTTLIDLIAVVLYFLVCTWGFGL